MSFDRGFANSKEAIWQLSRVRRWGEMEFFKNKAVDNLSSLIFTRKRRVALEEQLQLTLFCKCLDILGRGYNVLLCNDFEEFGLWLQKQEFNKKKSLSISFSLYTYTCFFLLYLIFIFILLLTVNCNFEQSIKKSVRNSQYNLVFEV